MDQETRLATLMYRGVLKREPDAEGLAHMVAALRADGSTAAVTRMLEAFVLSEEAKALSGAMKGGLIRPHDGPFGPFRHYISLGTSCYASWIIKGLGLKRQSYPLDWCFSSPAMVLDMLEDDFASFLDPRQYRTTPMAERARPEENVADHLRYRDAFGVRYVFNHRDPGESDTYGYFSRGAERFRRVMQGAEPKFLLMVSPHHPASEAVFAGLCERIDRDARHAMLLAINVAPLVDGDVVAAGPRLLRQIGPHRLVRYDATSRLDGLAFRNGLDDVVIRHMVTQYTHALDD